MEQQRYKIMIIDDQLSAVNRQRKRIEQLDSLEFIGYETDPLIAIEKIKSGALRPDLVLLDIQMPEMSGFDVAQEIAPFTQIIFLTGYPDFALKAYDYDPQDFVTKDASDNRLIRSIEKATRQVELKRKAQLMDKESPLTLKIDGRNEWFERSEIEYVAALDYLTKVFFSNKTFRLSNMTMKEMEEYLSPNGFVRIHKSYIINLGQVASYSSKSVMLRSGAELPVGRSYKEEFKARIQQDAH